MGTKALVLSGGGSRGAFQAGVLHSLILKKGMSWNLVAGVSVGALNGSMMAMHAPAEQGLAVEKLRALWMDIQGNKSIYRGWLLGYFQSLWEGGLYDTTPLRKLVSKHFHAEAVRQSGVKLRMGAVSYETGQYKYVTEQSERLAEWVMASSAFPFAFPPEKIDGESWIDGGARDVTPIRDVVAEPDLESIDVILCGPRDGHIDPLPSEGARNALKVGLRTIQLLTDEVYIGDLQATNPPNCRVYAAPKDLKLPEPLDFSPSAIRAMFEAGQAVGGS